MSVPLIVTETDTEATPATPDTEVYALVEIMGHRKHYGRIREVSIAGAGFLEVVTPELPALPAGERRATRPTRIYDENYGGYRIKDEPGSYLIDALDAVPSEVFFYAPGAIFGIQHMTKDEVLDRHRSCEQPRHERWVPDVENDTRPALPAPDIHSDEMTDPWATDTNNDEDNEE